MSDIKVPLFDPTAKKRPKKHYRKTEGSKTDLSADDQKLLADFGSKRRPKKTATTAEDAKAAEASSADASGAEKDYTYEEMLNRVFSILEEKNPEHGTRTAPIMIKTPSVGREGKKTVWFNFGETCKQLNRTAEHFSSFVFAELGTSGSLDANKCLVIRGRYMAKHIEHLIRKYMKDYVICASCKSFKTTLSKDNRLHFLTCNECHSKRTVQPIKRGYEAQIGKRKKTEGQ